MLICIEENCSCIQHRFLNCLQTGLNDEAKLLLQKLENVWQLIDTSGLTLLHYAVKFGNAEMTQHLIGEGCNVNAQDNFGVTPLMMSVKAEDLKTSEILMKNNADIYVTGSDGRNGLHLAFHQIFDSRRHRPNPDPSRLILDMLFDKVNEDFSKGSSTQFWSNANNEAKLAVVAFGNAEVMKFILDNGYPVEFCEPRSGRTAFHYAIIYAKFGNATTLIERGANVDALDKNGVSPLYDYIRYFEDVDENSEVLKVFLKNSKRLYVPYERGLTDVGSVLFFGKEKSVRTLLMSDVDVYGCSTKKRSPLQYLIINREIDNIDFLDELDIEFDVNDPCPAVGTVALTTAAFHSYPKKINYLLQRGADVNFICPNFGTPALSSVNLATSAVESDVTKSIELLLQHGADAQRFLIDRPHFVNDNNFTDSTKVILAHLAMLGAVEPSTLTDLSREKIESQPLLRGHFMSCTKQLDEMKNLEVHGTVTLFKLLTEREDKVAAYTRNQELASAMSKAMENLTDYEGYYSNTLKRNISKGLDVAKLQLKAALAIETLTGLCTDVYHVIIYKIISYLDNQDLCNLCQIDTRPSTTLE